MEQTEQEFFERFPHLLRAHYGESTPWRQVSGDLGASEVRALFGRYNGYGSYDLVEIRCSLEIDGGQHDLPHYLVWVASYNATDLAEDGRRAWDAMGYGIAYDDPEVTEERRFEAMFEYGVGVDPDKGLRYDGVEGFDTLKEAMDDQGIPAEALWDPREYTAVPSEYLPDPPEEA